MLRFRPNRSTITQVTAAWLITLLLTAAPEIKAQQAEPLTLDRLFASGEFFGERPGQFRWLEEGGYTTLDRSETVQGGRDIVRHDPATGSQEIMVSASLLVPEGSNQPIPIQGYGWSEDGSKMLIFTNSRRVWRSNTRGDYWVLDLKSRRLRQLGLGMTESSMMYAKFSPDGSRVGWLRDDPQRPVRLGLRGRVLSRVATRC